MLRLKTMFRWETCAIMKFSSPLIGQNAVKCLHYTPHALPSDDAAGYASLLQHENFSGFNNYSAGGFQCSLHLLYNSTIF
jgi:hypothetical protein